MADKRKSDDRDERIQHLQKKMKKAQAELKSLFAATSPSQDQNITKGDGTGPTSNAVPTTSLAEDESSIDGPAGPGDDVEEINIESNEDSSDSEPALSDPEFEEDSEDDTSLQGK